MNKDIIIIDKKQLGLSLLKDPALNKGTAFSTTERLNLNLLGLLPAIVETLSDQTGRVYDLYTQQSTALAKHLLLRQIFNRNHILFFNLVSQHLTEMLPIIYTPTVGDAVLTFSKHLLPKGGLYLSAKDMANFELMVNNLACNNYDVIVLTDGQAVLGIGDQGIAGMEVCFAKAFVYTLCGGIAFRKILPVILDVGTNNEDLLADPWYLGCKNKRLVGDEYFAVIKQAAKALSAKFPQALFHWEDFSKQNAQQILDLFDDVCGFNDDIQGTGAAALAAILTACKLNKTHLENQVFLIYGAGVAGLGIAECIYQALIRNGVAEQIARDKIWLIDKCGLITKDLPGLSFGLTLFAKPRIAFKKQFKSIDLDLTPLHQVIAASQPSVLIGCSAQAGAFNEATVKLLLTYLRNPIILPLSNPTEKAEATPQDLIEWSNGKARIATGSPYDPVIYKGAKFVIAQCNNALIFPGIGLGCSLVKSSKISQSMLWAASQSLAKVGYSQKKLLPDIADIRMVSAKIAVDVAKKAFDEGLTEIDLQADYLEVYANMWQPHYPQISFK